ncbi:ribonuclease H-like domain-containing protein, partial [Tanacetum coccineum]
QRSKEDEIQKISTSLFITNFPDSFFAKDGFNTCSQYGNIVDAFIPTKRSKAGKRWSNYHGLSFLNTGPGVTTLCANHPKPPNLHSRYPLFQPAPTSLAGPSFSVSPTIFSRPNNYNNGLSRPTRFWQPQKEAVAPTPQASHQHYAPPAIQTTDTIKNPLTTRPAASVRCDSTRDSTLSRNNHPPTSNLCFATLSPYYVAIDEIGAPNSVSHVASVFDIVHSDLWTSPISSESDIHRGSDIAYLLLYVDDIVLTASSTALLQRIITVLHGEFAMTDLGSLNYFLGVISHSGRLLGCFLSQSKYCREILEQHTFNIADPCRTPVDRTHTVRVKLGSDVDPLGQSSTLYAVLQVLSVPDSHTPMTSPDVVQQVLYLGLQDSCFYTAPAISLAYTEADWACIAPVSSPVSLRLLCASLVITCCPLVCKATGYLIIDLVLRPIIRGVANVCC